MLIQGDSALIPLPDNSVQLIVTSPPYLNARSYSQWETYDDYLAETKTWWEECYRILCEGGRIAVNVPQGYGRPGNGTEYLTIGADTTELIKSAGFVLRGHIIWNKTSHVLKGNTGWGSWLSASNPFLRDQHEIIIVAHKGNAKRTGKSTIDKSTFVYATSSIWVIPPQTRTWHPAPFPKEIPKRLIELYSFEGDIVCDPFSGSGTTERMAIQLGRKGIGLDLKYEYCRRAKDSLPQLKMNIEFEDE